MPAIHIRDIPAEVLAALKRRAAANHRSLQKELQYVLAKLAQEAPPATPVRRVLNLITVSVPGTSTWGRDEIYGDTDPDGR